MSTTGTFSYPQTRRCDQVDNYHGVEVADPFRWLEDADSAETASWVEAQNAVTMPFIASLPYRDQLRARLTQLWDYEKRGVPRHRGKRYFWYYNSGLQNQYVLYTSTNPKAKRGRVLIDPNTFSEDGTVALAATSINPDGSLIAYAKSKSGSDWMEWFVRDIATGEDLSDHLQWSKFSGAAWTKDGKGFFYCRYPANTLEGKNVDQKVYYHVVGTTQDEDTLVYERPDFPEWSFGVGVTDDKRYLIISSAEGFDGNRLFIRDLEVEDAPIVELFGKADAHYSIVDNDGTLFWLQTDLDAPRYRVMSFDLTTFDPADPELMEVIPEAEQPLEDATLLDNKFVLSYLQDAHTVIKIHDRAGKFVRTVNLPGVGTVSGFGGKRRQWKTFFHFTSFSDPGSSYRYDMRTDTWELYIQPSILFDPADYQTEQVFYESADGTRVPMFICYKKGMKRNATNPTYLYGYGGFSVSMTPEFSLDILLWMEMGGIFAQPNLRGGAEYGEQWHIDGTKLKKQNVFDDFIAAAEYLIANGYTSTPKLAIGGGSNGGLLVGACMTQRPELFAAAFPAVGVMDMLRFHTFTIGRHWTSDYGCSENPEEFAALHKYSPVHNVRPARYPTTLVSTADHDDRVVPAHSFKFISELQAAHQGDNPVLIRIETKAGHGAGKPTAKIIEETSDKWAFAIYALDFTPNIVPV